MENKVAIIGAGISGISLAKMLEKTASVTVFEQKPNIGGLISCDRVEDVLYHRVGGHVFNSKNQEVLNWFWKFFNKEEDFIKAKRFAKVFFDGSNIGYPIENHLFQLNSSLVDKIISDLLDAQYLGNGRNFEEFLLKNFGHTLYDIYFKPYNKKIWNVDLADVPLEWLEGKLPMPNIKDIIASNILRVEEGEMVHASFYYPKVGGSQFIINNLSNGLNIVNDCKIDKINFVSSKGWFVNGYGPFDKVVYTGDVRYINDYLGESIDLSAFNDELKSLKSNGTTNVLCRCDDSELSWLYIPEEKYKAHRIIYTGNFSATNNDQSGRSSCTVEFSNFVPLEQIYEELKTLPGNLEFVSYNYEPNSYVIQDKRTRSLILELKNMLSGRNIFLLGRFAEWEYNNMDKCIEAAMALTASSALNN